MKKSILILLSIIFLGTYKCSETLEIPDPKTGPISYECEDLIKTRADTTLDYSFSMSKNQLVISDDGGKTGFGIGCSRFGVTNSILIMIKVVGAGRHIDEGNVVDILFRDGTRLTLSNGSSTRAVRLGICFGGVFQKNKELNELTTKEIEIMQVWTNKGYIIKGFSSEQSKILMNTLKCLSQL